MEDPGDQRHMKEKQLKAWKNYQQSVNNDVSERIKIFQLTKYGGPNKTLLDVGSNNGEFPINLSSNFLRITAVEPFVEPLSDLPKNISWIKKTFKHFAKEYHAEYDVVLSLAMSIQAKELDGLSEDEIAGLFINWLKRVVYFFIKHKN